MHLLCFPVTKTPIIPKVWDENQFGTSVVHIRANQLAVRAVDEEDRRLAATPVIRVAGAPPRPPGRLKSGTPRAPGRTGPGLGGDEEGALGEDRLGEDLARADGSVLRMAPVAALSRYAAGVAGLAQR